MTTIKLTQFSHGAGCGCKIAPDKLEQILSKNKSTDVFANLLVGNQTNDDAAVWDLENGQALISTVDFFMPIVDDAFNFGRIAATNALSDVYAMGGKPIFANAILGWPIDKLPLELATKVIEGAQMVCKQANIPIAGGHSIDSLEPMFGLAVNGLINKQNIKQNSAAKAGDLLFLTKPLGTGIIGTAIKRGLIEAEAHAEICIESMCILNSVGYDLSKLIGVSALTDVTGFGLLGHLIEMAEGANLTAEINWKNVPYFEFIDSYLQKNIIPDNTYRNWNVYEKKVFGLNDKKAFQILNDPQTSGGLLISIHPDAVNELEELFKSNNLKSFIKPIGCFKNETPNRVEVIL
ncbi:MAG: selenide, water dikinase SelD [Bacteroidia bacterium]|nr:selenide, water dikinase SelD [Bacteroidia bacterium]